jgi:hypothetical protein
VFKFLTSRKFIFSVAMSMVCAVLSSTMVIAGDGLVLEGAACTIQVDIYSVEFAAYQPDSSGNTQFCQELPDTGHTIMVLDYLHPSLKEVGVDFRIIRDVTGQGSFVKLKHIDEIEDIEQQTIFYQAPSIEADASLQIEYELREKGRYIAIINAEHPSNGRIYTAIFPFEVGALKYSQFVPLLLLLAVPAYFLRRRYAGGPNAAAKLRTPL